MELNRIATRVVSTHPRATVLSVAEQMVREKIGALVVLDEGRLVGIVSERDIVGRMVARHKEPAVTLVAEIMTAEVTTIGEGATTDDALERMHQGKFRHLPLVDRGGRVIGMLSIRHLLRDRMDELALKNNDLYAFISADGPGG